MAVDKVGIHLVSLAARRRQTPGLGCRLAIPLPMEPSPWHRNSLPEQRRRPPGRAFLTCGTLTGTPTAYRSILFCLGQRLGLPLPPGSLICDRFVNTSPIVLVKPSQLQTTHPSRSEPIFSPSLHGGSIFPQPLACFVPDSCPSFYARKIRQGTKKSVRYRAMFL